MKITFRRTAATAALLVGSLALAPLAQANGPKTVDAAQSAILVKAAPTEISPEDIPWGLPEGRTEIVHITFQGVMILLPWIEVERDGDDSVAIAMPPTATAIAGPGEKELPFAFEVASDNWTMDFERADGGDEVDFSMQSNKLTVSINGAESLTALNGEFVMDNLEIATNIKQFNAVVAAAEANRPFGKEVIEILDFDAKISADSYISKMSTPSHSGQAANSTSESGPWSGELVMRDGRLSGSASSEGGKIAMDDPLPINVTHGEVSYEFSMPTKGSPDLQEMSGSMRMGEINVDESLWAMIDPGGEFDHTFDGLAFDMAFTGIFAESLMDPRSRGADSIDPKTATLNTFEFNGLGLEAKGKANATFENSNPSDITGYFSVKGLSEVIAAAQKIGLMPPQQGQMIEGMANQLGKKEGGALVFDIQSEGGMLLVNDAPIAPIPGAQ